MSFDICMITKYRELWDARRWQVSMISQLYNFMPPSILKRLKFLLCSLLKSSLQYQQDYSFTRTYSLIHSPDTQGSIYCVPAQPRPAQQDKAGPPWWNMTVRFCLDPEASVGAIPRHKPSPHFVSVRLSRGKQNRTLHMPRVYSWRRDSFKFWPSHISVYICERLLQIQPINHHAICYLCFNRFLNVYDLGILFGVCCDWLVVMYLLF